MKSKRTLREILTDIENAKPKKKTSETDAVRWAEKEDFKFLGVEPDNDNGMCMYDYLYNDF